MRAASSASTDRSRFAVWDRVTRELFLARDRYGVRPLFVARFGRQLVFASEAKAILRHPLARRELDPRGVVETFTLWSILPDRSAFAGIGELAPGHWLRIGPHGETTRRWWDLAFAPGSCSAARRSTTWPTSCSSC
ncbi:MAG: hypothetical protein R2755_22550 [Acidimicrobiales bacterium]